MTNRHSLCPMHEMIPTMTRGAMSNSLAIGSATAPMIESGIELKRSFGRKDLKYVFQGKTYAEHVVSGTSLDGTHPYIHPNQSSSLAPG